MQLIDNLSGNYRFLTGIAPYSAGVTAQPGYEIVRAVLARPLPWRDGFARIDKHLTTLGRPGVRALRRGTALAHAPPALRDLPLSTASTKSI